LAQHLRGGRMAQDMGAIDGTLDLGPLQGAGSNLGDRLGARRRQGRCDGEKHMRARDARLLVRGIVQQGVAHLLREGEACLPPILADNAPCAVVPVDITPLQGSDIPCAEPSACQQQQHSAVAAPARGGPVTAPQHPFDRLSGQIPGQGGQTPMRYGR
jgi:hypothetical protein